MSNFLKIKIDTLKYFFYEKYKKKFLVNFKDTKIFFAGGSRFNNYRIKTFSTKEPFTLDWIDKFEEDSVLWDIGANIGIYSCYAGVKTKSYVYCFEPNLFNLKMLMKNLQLNALENKSTIIPLALTSKDEVNYLYQHQSGMVEGGASTSFNEKFNEKNSKISLPGISADTLLNNFKLKKPDYIKIDVDGNEVDILLGIKNVIKDVKSVLIEIDSRLENNTKIYALLSNCNLSIKSEHIYDKNVKYQIWE